jgi:hypothetical protein
MSSRRELRSSFHGLGSHIHTQTLVYVFFISVLQYTYHDDCLRPWVSCRILHIVRDGETNKGENCEKMRLWKIDVMILLNWIEAGANVNTLGSVSGEEK